MSGLYNVVFGERDEGATLVGIVNEVQAIDVGRYRDAWVEKHNIAERVRSQAERAMRSHGLDPTESEAVAGLAEAEAAIDPDYLIRIHTRNGGGNREDYIAEIESMRRHPWFVRDVDDDYDRTYADFYFRIPDDIDPKLHEGLVSIAQEPVNMGDRWKAVIEALKNS